METKGNERGEEKKRKWDRNRKEGTKGGGRRKEGEKERNKLEVGCMSRWRNHSACSLEYGN